MGQCYFNNVFQKNSSVKYYEKKFKSLNILIKVIIILNNKYYKLAIEI